MNDFEDDRVIVGLKAREGLRGENGLQAHLRVVHGYGLTRLAALSVIKLVCLHQQNADGHPK